MALDQALIQAVKESVQKMGQPEVVNRRMLAWLEDMSQGNVSDGQNLEYYTNLMDEIITDGIADAD